MENLSILAVSVEMKHLNHLNRLSSRAYHFELVNMGTQKHYTVKERTIHRQPSRVDSTKPQEKNLERRLA